MVEPLALSARRACQRALLFLSAGRRPHTDDGFDLTWPGLVVHERTPIFRDRRVGVPFSLLYSLCVSVLCPHVSPDIESFRTRPTILTPLAQSQRNSNGYKYNLSVLAPQCPTLDS